MTLIHFLLIVVPAITLTFVFSWIQNLIGVDLPFEMRYWFSFPLAFIASIFLAWPFARLLGYPPLMIYSGPCPSCKHRPPGWRARWISRDCVELACGLCEERVELWLTSRPSARRADGPAHRYILRTPRFLGVWRRIES